MNHLPSAKIFSSAALDFQAGLTSILHGGFTLPPASVTALIGGPLEPKKALFQLLHGQSRPSHGHIRLQGKMIVDQETGLWVPPHQRGIGWVPQTPTLWGHWNIEKNLRGFQHFRPLGNAHDTDAIIEHLGLQNTLSNHPHQISQDEQWLVTLVRGILSAQSLLLVENIPFFAETSLRHDVFRLLQNVADSGLPVLFIGDTAMDALRYAQYYLPLNQGHLGETKKITQGDWDFSSNGEVGGEPGMFFDGIIKQRDLVYRLNNVTFSGGTMILPAVTGEIGSPIKIRIRCQDVILALDHPNDTSINNIFSGQIKTLKSTNDNSHIEVAIDIGRHQPCIIRTQILKRLVDELHIAVGSNAYVLIRHAIAI